MNEQAGTGREHVSRRKRTVVDGTVALAANHICVALRLRGATHEHGCEQSHDEQDSRHET
jgi:hypothetical protein